MNANSYVKCSSWLAEQNRNDDETIKEQCSYLKDTEALCLAYLTHFKCDLINLGGYNALVK